MLEPLLIISYIVLIRCLQGLCEVISLMLSLHLKSIMMRIIDDKMPIIIILGPLVSFNIIKWYLIRRYGSFDMINVILISSSTV
jgi:hypothetical protein